MLNNININDDAINNGKWFKLGKTKLKIAHVSSRRFKKAVSEKTKDGVISVNDACKAMAEGVLLDWKSIKHIDGKNVMYTVDMATYALLTNAMLREFVEKISTDFKNFEGV